MEFNKKIFLIAFCFICTICKSANADEYGHESLKKQANQFLNQYESSQFSADQLSQFETESQNLIKQLQSCERRADEDISQLVEIREIDALEKTETSGSGITSKSETKKISVDVASGEVDRQITAATKALISCRLKLTQISDARLSILEQRQKLWIKQLTQKQQVWSITNSFSNFEEVVSKVNELIPVNIYFFSILLMGLMTYAIVYYKLRAKLIRLGPDELVEVNLARVTRHLLSVHMIPFSLALFAFMFLEDGGTHLLILFTGLLLRDSCVALSLRHIISDSDLSRLRNYVLISSILLILMSIGLSGIHVKDSINYNWLSKNAFFITPLIVTTAIFSVLSNWQFYKLLNDSRDSYLSLFLSVAALASLIFYILSYANGAQYLLVVSLGMMLVHWAWKSINWLRKIILIKRLKKIKQDEESENRTFAFPFWISLFVALISGITGLVFVGWLAGINEEAYKHISFTFNEGFEIGSIHFVPKDIFIGIVILAILIMLLSGIKSGIQNRWFDKSRLRKSSREVFSMVVWYIGITIAVFIALTVAGFDISNLAIIAGALSVGIGFGLKNIVSNFVSGLILLFERPVTRGDWVEIGDTVGLIEKVKIRATRIRTFDNAEILVPNSELLAHHVTNWTLSNSIGRITIKVGVAYGSDVNQVLELLDQVAKNHGQVMQREPYLHKVLFREFGDSSLNFELRVMIKDIKKFLDVETELNLDITSAFKDAGIEIPFPQRDLHIKDSSALALDVSKVRNENDESNQTVKNDPSDGDHKNHSQAEKLKSLDSSDEDKGEVEQMIEEDEKRKEKEEKQREED